MKFKTGQRVKVISDRAERGQVGTVTDLVVRERKTLVVVTLENGRATYFQDSELVREVIP